MPAKLRPRVAGPLPRRIRWGNVARLAALVAAIPLFVVVLGGGDPASRRLGAPLAPPAHRAPADPPPAKTRSRRPRRRAELRRHPKRRNPRPHDRPSRTTDGAPSQPLPAPAAPPAADPQGEEFAPG